MLKIMLKICQLPNLPNLLSLARRCLTFALAGLAAGVLAGPSSAIDLNPIVSVRKIDATDLRLLVEAQHAMAAGAAADALALYDTLLARAPDSVAGLTGRAAALQKLGRNDDARRASEQVLAAGGASYPVLANMALMDGTADPRAIADRLQRLARDDSGGVHDAVIAQAQASAGNWDAAAASLRRALKRMPSHPDLLWNYAVVLDSLGDGAEAARYYRIAIDMRAPQATESPVVAAGRVRLAWLDAQLSAAAAPGATTPSRGAPK